MSTTDQTHTGPKWGRPNMPQGYGVPADNEGLLPWSHIQERMGKARNYWIGTARPDGRPHATPVWGVWVDDVLYIEGGPDTRRGRNIEANPAVAVHLDLALVSRLVQAISEKYAFANYKPDPQNWEGAGLYGIRPRVVIAWTKFPRDATRWVF